MKVVKVTIVSAAIRHDRSSSVANDVWVNAIEKMRAEIVRVLCYLVLEGRCAGWGKGK